LGEVKKVDEKYKESFNLLVSDEFVAHYAFLKERYRQPGEYEINLFSKFKQDQLQDFIEENNIKLSVIFVYGRRGLYKILDFIGLDVDILICAHEANVWWLTEAIPNIELVELSLPKEELFCKIDMVVRRKIKVQ
jgi:hypothetical protein